MVLEKVASKAMTTKKTNAKRLHELEQQFEQGVRQAAEAIRAIREEELYVEQYGTFEQYVEQRWTRTKVWAYQQLRWLQAVETLEEHKVKAPLQNLSVDSAKLFRQYEARPEIFIGAYERLTIAGEKITKARLERECTVEANYISDTSAVPDLTWEEHQAYSKLTDLPIDYGSWDTVKKATLEECVAHSKQKRQKIALRYLTKFVRGDDFITYCTALQKLAAEATTLKTLEAKKRQLQAEKSQHSRNLNDAIKQADQEIATEKQKLGIEAKEEAVEAKEEAVEAKEEEPQNMTEFLADIWKRVKIVVKYREDLNNYQIELVQNIANEIESVTAHE